MEIRLKAAEGAAKSDLEAQIQTTRERLQAIEQIKWEVSEEALAEYAQVLEKCTLSGMTFTQAPALLEKHI